MKVYFPKWRARQTPQQKTRSYLRTKELDQSNMKRFLFRKTLGAIAEDRRHGLKSDLNKKFVYGLYENDGRCALCYVKLHHDGSVFSASIDRINNDHHHIKSNVQLTCTICNLAKNKTSDKEMKFFIEVLKGNVRFGFYRWHRDYITAKIKNFKRKEGAACNLTTSFVEELYKKQNGICYLGSTPIIMAKFSLFSVSCDRINNLKPHTMDNIKLTSVAMNRAKKSRSIQEIENWIEEVRNGR